MDKISGKEYKMKKYESPTLKMIIFQPTDIITASIDELPDDEW